jgi:hypothetical protein
VHAVLPRIEHGESAPHVGRRDLGIRRQVPEDASVSFISRGGLAEQRLFIATGWIRWVGFAIAPRLVDAGVRSPWVVLVDRTPRSTSIRPRRAWRFGRDWRAVSDDPSAAALCGVDTGRVFRGAVVLGGLFAALAGILAGLYFGNISFGTGLVFGLKVLFITAVGGYSQPLRAAVGAALFGMAETLWAGYFPIEWRDGWMFLLLVAMLVLRPPSQEDASQARP